MYVVTRETCQQRPISVSKVLQLIGVESNGYYKWKRRRPSSQEEKKNLTKDRLEELYVENRGLYGAPKLTELLQREGYTAVERTVGKYMRELGIRAKYIRPYTTTTTGQDFSDAFENILKREFNPTNPNVVWVTDITYIPTIDPQQRFVYLTSIMDLYSRKIIAWDVSDSLAMQSVLKVVREALETRDLHEPVLIHSDRGTQFISNAYMEILEGHTLSYSDKANPWDNAVIEAFHALIKREHLNEHVIRNLEHAQQLVFEYIETFYNTTRIHGSIGYQTPNEKEASQFEKYS